MSSISKTFEDLKNRGEKALICFVTAGDPHISELPAILETVAEAGADIIEVGLPFSDPIADGSVIQAASQRALDTGVKVQEIFEALSGFNGPPIVLMGYLNTVLSRGMDEFATLAKASGVSGSIICDLTPEEANEWIGSSQRAGLDTVFLAAPTSTHERIKSVVACSTGFVYAVSRTGVTGIGGEQRDESRGLVDRIREHTKLPVCVGFGIDTPVRVREVCQYADGAIVGSYLVNLIHNEWNGGKGQNGIQQAISELKKASRI